MVSVLQDPASASLLLAPSSADAPVTPGVHPSDPSDPAADPADPAAVPAIATAMAPDPPGQTAAISSSSGNRPKLRIAKKLGRKLRNNYNNSNSNSNSGTGKQPKKSGTGVGSKKAAGAAGAGEGAKEPAHKATTVASPSRADRSVDATLDTTVSGGGTPDKRGAANAKGGESGISIPAALGLGDGSSSRSAGGAAAGPIDTVDDARNRAKEDADADDADDDDASTGSMSRLVDIFGAALAATAEAARKDREKEEAEAAALEAEKRRQIDEERKRKYEQNEVGKKIAAAAEMAALAAESLPVNTGRRGGATGPVDLDDTVNTTLPSADDPTPSSLGLNLLPGYHDDGDVSGGEESLLDASVDNSANDDVEVSFEEFTDQVGSDNGEDDYATDDIFDDDDDDNRETSFDSCVKEFTLDESIDEGEEEDGDEEGVMKKMEDGRPKVAAAAAMQRRRPRNIMDMDENMPDDELLIDDSMHHMDELMGTRGENRGNDWVAFDDPDQNLAFLTDKGIGSTIQAWPPAVTPPVTPSRTTPHPTTATYTSLSTSISPVRPSTPSLPSRAEAAAALAAARAITSGEIGCEDFIDRDPDVSLGLNLTADDGGDALPSSSGPPHATKSVSDDDDDEGEEDVHTIPSISTTTDDTHQTNNKSPCRPGTLASTPQRPPRGISSPARRGTGSPAHPYVGQSPGRFGKRLIDDDSATILTEEGSYLFSTPQRKDKNNTVPLPSPPPSAHRSGKDESFESQNVLDVTSETITINNKSVNSSITMNNKSINSPSERFNESSTRLGTINSDAHTVGSETLQTVDDHDLGSPTSVNDSDASFVVERNSKAGSRAIPGVSGHTNKEVCAMFHQVEEFFDEVAADLQYSVKDLNRKLDYMCVGDDEVAGGRRLECNRVRSTISRRRNGSKRERLEKIMSKRGMAMSDSVEGGSGKKPTPPRASKSAQRTSTSSQGGALSKQQWSKDNFAC
eukprot:CAMPEP_0178639016 /NCGR_PEP_ID=MMETSP0698-20121128/15226_1 /TAXON_ID=265572 /ORGANISM="Extubocellulus spinifer, Strain CCMP396" /LENGTH=969 /DNA_ID=CAMNT_0020279297 /DNA_START=530 /DNA_END=3440 /DNA_ORIENTATION=+